MADVGGASQVGMDNVDFVLTGLMHQVEHRPVPTGTLHVGNLKRNCGVFENGWQPTFRGADHLYEMAAILQLSR